MAFDRDLRMPDKEAATAQRFRAVVGGFIQNFAILEVAVAAWLMKLEKSHADAVRFLIKTRQFDARAKRLRKHFAARHQHDLVKAIDDVEPFRLLRNDLVHGPMAITSGSERISIITWKSTRQITADELQKNMRTVAALTDRLVSAYAIEFGVLKLHATASAAPPAVE